MNSTIIFLSLMIIFLSLMLIIDINLIADTNSQEIQILIKIYKIKIITIRLSFAGLFYKISGSKKFKTLNIFLTKQQKYFIKQIKQSILDKLYYDRIKINYILYTSSSAVTANIVGTTVGLSYLINSYLSERKKDTEILILGNANFLTEQTKFEIKVRVFFTLFDMVFAILLSLYKRGYYGKEKQRKL